MLGLVVANRILIALEDERAATRSTLEEERRIALRDETAWLIRDGAEKGLVFERDGGEVMWSVN